MNDVIQKKLDALIEAINEQEEVQRYKQIEIELGKNRYFKDKMKNYKRWQQKVVLYEHQHHEVPKEIETKLDSMYQELLDIPIYNEYLNLQADINEVIQQITFIIETEINKKQ